MLHGTDTSLTEQVCPGRQADGINTSKVIVLAETDRPGAAEKFLPHPKVSRDPSAAKKYFPHPKVSRERPRCSREVLPLPQGVQRETPVQQRSMSPTPKVSREKPSAAKMFPPEPQGVSGRLVPVSSSPPDKWGSAGVTGLGISEQGVRA